jgi:hypothetical protein
VTDELEVFEYEVWLSTFAGLHAGETVTEVVKYLVAAVDDREGYRIALDAAWRGDRQVTKVWWVP